MTKTADEQDVVPESTGMVGDPTFLNRWAMPILILTALLLPGIVFGGLKALKVYSNDVKQWLPEGYEEARIYDQFQEKFGIDEMVVISWKDCRIDNPDVLKFQDALQAKTNEAGTVFSNVNSGPSMLDNLLSIGVSREAALKRLEGLVIGADGSTTCVLASPSESSVGDRRTVIEAMLDVAQETLGLAPDQLKMAGPTMDGAAINIESEKSLNRYLWMCMATVFFIAWFRLRDLPLTIMVIVFAALSAVIALSILYFSGGKMNLTMVMLPSLVFILGVSGSVHMVNYYRKASIEGHGIRSADVAIADGRYPVMLSSLTTAIGLCSLGTSQVGPIRNFGLYSAAGIMASLPLIVYVLPATLYLFKGRISKRFSTDGKLDERERRTGVSRSTSILMYTVIRTHIYIVAPALIILTLVGVGIFQLRASVKIQNRFAGRAKIIQDYEWLEERLGPLVPMEVVVRCDPECELTLWEQMQVVQSIERTIKRTTDVQATMSAALFEPPMMGRSNSVRGMVAREAKLKKWEQNFGKLREASFVHKTGDEELWRISLRVAALNDIDYGDFLDDVSNNVESQLKHIDRNGLSAWLTGGIPLFYKAQHQILNDLMISFCTAFLLIALVLMFVLNSVRAGLIAMVPNVFPPLIVFGTMGWLGQSIEIGSVMTASVALGIAVDDTLHYLTWYRRGLNQGLSRNGSIRFAFQHCAKPMLDTSLICGLGVTPFLLSVFMPTVKFAGLLSVLLMMALVGDLLLLPAILAGPAGHFFRFKKKKKARKLAVSEE